MRCDWATGTTAAASVVLLASMLRTSPLVLALLVGLAAFHGTLAVRAVRRSDGADDVGAGAAGAGARLGLFVVASLQLIGVSVTLWAACALLVVATSPAVRPALAAFVTLGADRPTTEVLPDLTDDVLLDLWRTSARMLLEPLPPMSRCRLVARRAQYLDELERRHPDRVQAWLAAELRGESF